MTLGESSLLGLNNVSFLFSSLRSAGQDELTIKCEEPQGKKALSELNDHRDGRFTLIS